MLETAYKKFPTFDPTTLILKFAKSPPSRPSVFDLSRCPKYNELMQNYIKTLIIGCLLLLTSQAGAALSPLAFSLVPPLQFPSSEFNVTGARLSVGWGSHRDVYGLDIGLLGNVTNGEFVGIGISGGANINYGYTVITGLQLAGITNYLTEKTQVYGLQLSMVNYLKAASHIGGLQLGLANLADHTDIYGFQAGIYNSANNVYGIQVGLINRAVSLHGLQIGLLNFNHTGLFSVSPFLNVGF